MTSLFRNKYPIRSSRYRGYDYSLPGGYFITICTKNKIPYFGNIDNGKMILSETGLIARDSWIAIPSHFPNTVLDEFIIMPDHIHGIIIIKPTGAELSVATPNLGVATQSMSRGDTSGMKSGNLYWKSNSIGSIINQFKRICTIITKTKGLDLAWQTRFHDHIIRNNTEHQRIRNYIINNPRLGRYH
jgi:putative transposase